ncbi:MAG: DUF4148 domain-containing protein [Pseudomonadota bacterium]
MNATKSLIAATAVFAAVASGMARADEADASQYVIQFQGTRTRAEVMAEAGRVPATRSTEPAGSRVAAPVQSTVDAQVLRAQAAQAVRTGQISRGEGVGNF